MKTINSYTLIACIGILTILNQACGPKKLAVQPAAEVVEKVQEEPVKVEEEKKPVMEEAPREPVAVAPPNYNFKNIQFEYDSHVLKTESYAILDQIAREMMKDSDAKFIIDGHASIEGTAAYNMELSIDRANAVKLYLVNSGIHGNNLATDGHGATKPTASNDTETGRATNRRVEIRLVGQ
ncbi:OmpA family protein [Parapedobacter tibetensis]|uniref:OmpA family protein n=1 Tax=Parapedobacter tibetensis TaxID=2972951 RepID=UPI00214DB0D4|nr:OmpA family protein [Parapedobacter tibetensis]